ncbi:hypothetical protein BH11PAT1_BH11PAT1_2310 [soil metagenome]
MKKIYLKIFIVNLFFALGIVTLHGLSSSHLLSPMSKPDVFDTVLPKLEMAKTTYVLTRDYALVPKSYASSEYDTASAYGVIDFDSGKIIQERHLASQLPIASLTKIMTAVVASDLLLSEDLLPVSKKSASVEPTRAGFLPGERLTRDELLRALLMTSANDAAEVLREGTDKKYGGEVFVRAMNAKAAFLGLSATHFENPQGYDETTHYSSVHDLAILTQYALSHYPLLQDIVKTDYLQMSATSTHKQYDLYNWNGLLDVYPETQGVKIGNTDAAQKTTVVISNRGGKKLLVIVLGAPGILERDEWAAALLDDGYQTTLGLKPIAVTEEMLRAKYATWKYWESGAKHLKGYVGNVKLLEH